MAQLPPPTHDDTHIDETADESFPASDPPAWTTSHAGSPPHPPWTLEHGPERRAALRADLDRLLRAAAVGDGAGSREGIAGQSLSALEDVVARSMLDAGTAIVREPIDDDLRIHNVEARLGGALREAPHVVIGARYDLPDPCGVAIELALVRALVRQRLKRPLRFVAFATARGSTQYVERLCRERSAVHAMVSLAGLDLAHDGREARFRFFGDVRSGPITRAARDAFRGSSRIGASALVLPSWLPPLARSDARAFARKGWPVVIVSDRRPLRKPHPPRGPAEPDVDRMAAAVFGLVAVVVRLAGGHA